MLIEVFSFLGFDRESFRHPAVLIACAFADRQYETDSSFYLSLCTAFFLVFFFFNFQVSSCEILCMFKDTRH